MTEKGILARHELEEHERTGAQTDLAGHCSATGALFAHAVTRKGTDDEGFIVEQLRQDVLWLGHSRIIIRSDNEPALAQLVEMKLTVLKLSGVSSAASKDLSHMTLRQTAQLRTLVNLSRACFAPSCLAWKGS